MEFIFSNYENREKELIQENLKIKELFFQSLEGFKNHLKVVKIFAVKFSGLGAA